MTLKHKAIALTLLIISFLIITILVIQKNILLINCDTTVFLFINTIHFSAFLDTIMLMITQILDPYQALTIFIIFGIYLIAKKEKSSLYILTTATAFGVLLPEALKFFIARVRPISHLLVETDSSFPSVHATVSAVFFCASLLLIAPLIQNSFCKKIFVVLAAITFPLVALSRIYLSVHWTSDVIAGLLLGCVCYLFSDILVRHTKAMEQ